jgi:SAM-dependent methyltransferase
MDPSREKLTPMKRWLSGFLDAESLEAPQREFIGHRDIITRNLSRYHFIAPQMCGTLLEIGCGRGYGLEVVGPRANAQFGIDVSPKFLIDACRGNLGTAFVCATGEALPLAENSFDSVIAFDVIEHTKDDSMFLAELKRVARQDALIALSTPNRLFTSGNRLTPLNPFHIREYVASEFRELLKANFASVELFGQFDQQQKGLSRNSLIDRIPIRWKYFLPHNLQSLISVALRRPLRIEDCRFQKENLGEAHTFVAVCRV